MNNHSPTPRNGQLQEVFDETAAKASEDQVARMLARAEQIPQGKKPARTPEWRIALLIPVAAAAAVALALGGTVWWSQTHNDTRVVTTTTVAPTTTPTTAASVNPSAYEQDEWGAFFPVDPLALLDGEGEGEGELWMSELDILHGQHADDDAYWKEIEQLLEEGG